MELIRKLCSFFKGKQDKRESLSSSDHERNAELSGKWLTLNHPYFFGKANTSSEGRWIVACDDSDGAGRGGYREKGNGRVILVDYLYDKVVHEIAYFERPVDAAISDCGDYIIHDSGFGGALRGSIIGINTRGKEVYRRQYRANIFNIGLSRCGRFAAVQTANSDNKDGNILEVLDLREEKIVFTIHPIGAWADDYLFDTNDVGELSQLHVTLSELGSFRYSAAGEFLDMEALQEAQLDKGNYTTKIIAAKELLKTRPTEDNARKALRAVDAALSQGAGGRNDWGAVAHRIRGESFELLGLLPDALKAYEQALQMNPKVGAQRRVTVLSKKLSVKAPL